MDRRVVEEIRTGTATFGESYKGGGKGIIDSQKDVGGWPELQNPVSYQLSAIPLKIQSPISSCKIQFPISYQRSP